MHSFMKMLESEAYEIEELFTENEIQKGFQWKLLIKYFCSIDLRIM